MKCPKSQKYTLPKWIQENIENFNRSVTNKEIVLSNQKPPNKSPTPDGFMSEFYQTFKNNNNSS